MESTEGVDMKMTRTSTRPDKNGNCGNCGNTVIRSGGTWTHANRSVLCPTR